MVFECREELGLDDYFKFVRSEGISSKIANKYCFEVLDVDGNGKLNRQEAEPLYYISKAMIISCNVCTKLLTGSFFSCFQCFCDQSGGDTFDLCCDCYEARRFKHHYDAIFYDNQSLLFNHRDRRPQRKKSELQLTAEAYYQNVSPEIKDEANDFFKEMDKNNKKEIGFDEYISYMSQKGFTEMANPEFFMKLNGRGNGRLDFMEVMTLYYIIQSRRTFCDCCGVFMDGVFFTCNKCFNDDTDKTFDVCPNCFKNENYKHRHQQRHFVDNYALLESKRIEALMEKKRLRRNEITSYQDQATTSSSTAMVIYNHQQIDRWLSFTSSVTGIAASVISILTNCSIM